MLLHSLINFEGMLETFLALHCPIGSRVVSGSLVSIITSSAWIGPPSSPLLICSRHFRVRRRLSRRGRTPYVSQGNSNYRSAIAARTMGHPSYRIRNQAKTNRTLSRR